MKYLRIIYIYLELRVEVREDSGLNGQDGPNISLHLEQVLSSVGYEEDKRLIVQVFQSREVPHASR